MTASGERAARNATWRFASTGVDAVRAAVTVPLIARELGVAGYGGWSVIATIIALLHPLVIGGTAGTIVREVARAPARAAAIVAAGRRIRLTAAGVAIPVAAAVALVLVDGTAGSAAAVLALGLVLEAIATPALMMAARLRDDLVSLSRAAGAAAATLGVVVAVLVDAGLVGIAAASLAGVGVTAAVACVLTARAAPLPRVIASASDLRGLVALAWPITLSSLLAAALLQADVALVDAFAGSAEAGVLGAAGRVLAIGIAIPAAISTALMPILAMRSSRDALEMTRRASWIAGAVGVAFGIAMTTGAPIVATILGSGFDGVRAVLPVLAVRVAISAVSAPWAALLLAQRGQREILAIQAIVFGVALATSVIVVPYAGAVGAAWVAVGGEVIAAVMQTRAARRRA